MIISGLDPAGPIFETMSDDNEKLDASGAFFVDVIHTCTRLSVTHRIAGLPAIPSVLVNLGTSQRMGDSDFYPNDGYDQPGCEGIPLGMSLSDVW